jgi:hypothetical protein
MTDQDKIKLARRAFDQHEESYGQPIPPRLLRFWRSGAALRQHRKCLAEDTKIPRFDPGSFRLVAVPPSWEVQSAAGGLDDAIVGPDGEWVHAGKFLPLFGCEQAALIVARLDSESCPIGWFEESSFHEEGPGYEDGVYLLSPSLGQFLETLVDLDDPTYECEGADRLWEDLAAD